MDQYENSEDTSDVSERGISEGVSEDSGFSDDLGGAKTRRPRDVGIDRRVAKAVNALQLKPAVLCSMCDSEPSAYLCQPCGRLTFCLKCCLSLHDNRFLGAHEVKSLANNETCTIEDLKELTRAQETSRLMQMKAEEKAASNILAEEEARASPSRGQELSAAELAAAVVGEESDLDLPALAADESIIQARLKELTHCSDQLRKLGIELSHEMEATRETTSTAVEAVRRKFDILRNLITAKEEEYVSVVQEAGKKRLEAATKGQIDANVVVSELHGYVAHSENQLDRLRGNRRLFNSTRRSMLDTSEKKLNEAEEGMHRLQDQLDAVRHQSLGVHITLEDAVESIQRLKPPQYLTERKWDEPHVAPVPASKFKETPGVKAFVQSSPVKNVAPVEEEEMIAQPIVRQSFAKEVEALRNSPLPKQRNASPARTAAALPSAASPLPASLARQAPSQAPPQRPPPQVEQKPVSLIARTAARRQSPNRLRSMFPPELEALRKQVSGNRSLATAQRTNSPARVGSAAAPRPTKAGYESPYRFDRTSTPTRRVDSPSRSVRAAEGEKAHVQRTASFSQRERASIDNHPGPGAYNAAQPFGSRGVLSTPPRRR